ncbi:uncharacterized protein TNCV_2915051 [Trichonephila clavipes]|nr:uncharacterized protein TNCV_2915051 [Trichonephila clavipes]
MIANYVNDQHDTWDQFLREFAYAIRTAVNETTGKPPAELFLGRKLITPFQKLVMVSDRTDFAVGDIERLFEEARRNTKAKHEKWEKYYNRRRRDMQIKVNDCVLIATHPLNSATKKVVAKFKPKFEGSYRVLEVKNNNAVIWKAEKKVTVSVDQVRIYRHRKCDETEIRTDNDRFNSCQVIYSQFGLAVHQNDHQARRRFVEWAQNEIAVVPDFHKRILFSDEAHFWLNGYVNKQNCRIWSEANPQVYVETPLHPEKLTVWCALWAGGILLQKR